MTDRLITRFDHVLAHVPASAADQYDNWRSKMAEWVDRRLARRDDLEQLIGRGNKDLMRLNHQNHSRYISSVLRLKSGADLVGTVSWVYRSYTARGFSPDYFPVELEAWIDAVREFLEPAEAGPVIDFYRLVIEGHRFFLGHVDSRPETAAEDEQEGSLVDAYLETLLAPDSARAIELARSRISTPNDVELWWERVIGPAMVEVGRLWESGMITVGQEHLASSITQRVMSLFYPLILERPRDRGSIVLAATPGELHEIGARMAADLLELRGWKVHFTGADTPWESIISLLRRFNAGRLCLSTTLPTNLAVVREAITRIRQADLPVELTILVGGQAYRHSPDLVGSVGASALAKDVGEADRLLRTAS